MAEGRLGTTPTEWVEQMAAVAVDNARACEREARRLRKIARTMRNPPRGVSVEYGGYGIVRFYGPEVKP